MSNNLRHLHSTYYNCLSEFLSPFLCIGGFISFYGVSHILKVLDDAAAIDAKAENGESILPLCGLPLAVKDSLDVVGYPTTASTPALQGSGSSCTLAFEPCFVTAQAQVL